MEALLQRKIIQCEEQEKIITELQTENATIQKRLGHVEQERSRQQETLTELSHTSEKTRDNLSKIKKKYEILVQAVQSAKRVMAAVLAVSFISRKLDSDRKKTILKRYDNTNFAC